MTAREYCIVYTFAYEGGSRPLGMDGSVYERGMIARRVAEWCGVSLVA